MCHWLFPMSERDGDRDVEAVSLGWRAPAWAYEIAAGINTVLRRQRLMSKDIAAIKADTAETLAAMTALTKPQLSIAFGKPTDQQAHE